MGQAEFPRSSPTVEARAHAASGARLRVFLRRVSPRGAMVQGADIAERAPGGVLILAGAGAGRPPLPRWRYAPRSD